MNQFKINLTLNSDDVEVFLSSLRIIVRWNIERTSGILFYAEDEEWREPIGEINLSFPEAPQGPISHLRLIKNSKKGERS